MTSPHSLPQTLIIDLSHRYGGSSSRVLSLLEHFPPGTLALAGVRRGDVTRRALERGLPVHIVGEHKADPRIILNLLRLIRQAGYQVLDTQNIQSKVYASLVARQAPVALVSTLNSWYSHEHGKASLRGKVYTALELATNWGLKTWYITVSAQDRQALLATGLSADRVRLIYNAVEPPVLPESFDRRAWRARFHLDPDGWLCLAVGRLVPVKGYDVLIEAIADVVARMPRGVCMIVGEGQERQALQRQIERRGLAGHVILPGYWPRSEVLAALVACDVFVMPSRYEGTPIALLEAASSGCPIVASNAGGIPELVTHQEHALLVPPQNALELSRAILQLIQDRSLAHRLGAQARKHVQERFNLNTQVRATMEVYRDAWLDFIRRSNEYVPGRQST